MKTSTNGYYCIKKVFTYQRIRKNTRNLRGLGTCHGQGLPQQYPQYPPQQYPPQQYPQQQYPQLYPQQQYPPQSYPQQQYPQQITTPDNSGQTQPEQQPIQQQYNQEDILERIAQKLSAYNIVFVIDDSTSMDKKDEGAKSNRWEQTIETLQLIVPLACRYDDDGVDICFINHHAEFNVSRSEDILGQFTKHNIFPDGGTYMGAKLKKSF